MLPAAVCRWPFDRELPICIALLNWSRLLRDAGRGARRHVRMAHRCGDAAATRGATCGTAQHITIELESRLRVALG